MAAIRKRGNSYLLVVSMGYDYLGRRIKPAQKTVKPPAGLTEKQAEKWLDEQALLFEMEVKNQKQPIDRSTTLAKYIETWLVETAPKKLAVSTLTREKQDIGRILPHLGHYKLIDITPDILRNFYDLIRLEKNRNNGKPLAEMTVEGIHSCLCGILTDAVRDGYITHNPAWGAYRRKGKRKEIFIADEEMLQKLIECLEQESIKYELYFKLIIYTGMRRGECCGLKWSDIDWKKHSIRIERNIVKVSHQDIIVKEPKTAAGQRMVYVSKPLIKLLKEFRKECEWYTQQYLGHKLEDDDFIFMSKSGVSMTPSSFTWRFSLILKKYSLPNELTVHSLRHSNASLLISQNVDVRTVANLLGHSQASTTLDIYTHAFDKTKKAASEKLGAVLDFLAIYQVMQTKYQSRTNVMFMRDLVRLMRFERTTFRVGV